ncbi:MAG TPA: TetR/AcrR family transcriptional regulator [Magnetospirillaceae bacterium]|jgi:TetR/AcrR family transcriptional repressor of nem operon
MRVSKEKAAANREKILNEAARLFRERGLAGIGVDELTEAAGLSYGSLYSHFGSKDGLMAEAVKQASANFATKMRDKPSMAAYVAQYLSADHRDDPGGGCSVATLASDMPRQSKAVRRAFTENFRGAVTRIGARMKAGKRSVSDDDVLAAVSTLVGAIIIARGVDDADLSDRVLAAAKARLR